MPNLPFPAEILLKDLPQDLQALIAKTAQDAGVSPDQAIILLLKSQVGGEGPRPREGEFHDLDELIGAWTTEESAEFNRWLSTQRTTDPAIWR